MTTLQTCITIGAACAVVPPVLSALGSPRFGRQIRVVGAIALLGVMAFGGVGVALQMPSEEDGFLAVLVSIGVAACSFGAAAWIDRRRFDHVSTVYRSASTETDADGT